MRWFICANGIRFSVDNVEMIVPYPDGTSVWLTSGRTVLLTPDEMVQLVAQIESENADSIDVKGQMFHYDDWQGAFPIASVRSWATYPEIGERRKITVVNLFDMPSANLFGDDIPRFLAAMGVPNEPT